MIDPTKGAGPVQNIQSGKSGQPADERKRVEEKRAPAKAAGDEVRISSEALTQQELDKAVADTKSLLRNSDSALGLEPGFITDALV